MFVFVAMVAGPVLVIETSALAAAVVMLQPLAAVFDKASRTLAVKGKAPAAPAGVPVIAPVPAIRFRPGGSGPPVMENVKGVVPPVATSMELYATPTWAE